MLHRIQPKKRLLIISGLLITAGLSCIFLFKLKKRSRPLSAPPLASTFKKKHFEPGALLLSEFNDLENAKDKTISPEKSFSGIKACRFTLSTQYGFVVSKKIADIPSYRSLQSVKLEIKYWARNDLAGAQYILSVEDKTGKSIVQLSKPIVCSKTYDWNTLGFSYAIDPQWLDPENTIRLYAWNKGSREFYVDDISVSFYGESEKGSHTQTYKPNSFYDFEKPDSALLSQQNYIKEGIAHSGKAAFDLSNSEEYGPMITRQFGDVAPELVKRVNMSVWVYPLTDNASVELAVSLFGAENKSYFWQGKVVQKEFLPREKWTKINASTALPAEGSTPDDVIQAIVRNKGKTKVLFDDLEIVYDDMSEPQGNVSTLDPNALYEKRFMQERNKPPFQTVFLQKTEINNGDGISITPKKNALGISDLTPADDFLVGDFVPDKDGLEEIICIKKFARGLYSYSPEIRQFNMLWEDANKADSLWNNSNDFYGGDFNGDKKTDVLLVNKKTKAWGIINFDGKRWKTVAQGIDPKPEWIAKKEKPQSELIHATDIVLQGNFIAEKPSLLRLNTDWRFELQWLVPDDGSYLILGNVDFKGYPKDHNPKYYEFVKLVAGNFISKNKTAVLVIMRNCADDNFDGKACREYEELDFLPGSIQVYQFE